MTSRKMDVHYQQQLAGKTLLVIGAGGIGRQPVWQSFKELGIKVILVDPYEDNHGVNEVDRFILYNFIDPRKYKEHAANIISLVGKQLEEISGCFCYSEYCTPLGAEISKMLGFRGTDPQAAMIARSKFKTYEVLKSRQSVNTYTTYQYSPYAVLVEKDDDIVKAEGISYPAILKPEHGSFSRCVKLVTSLEDCLHQYRKMQDLYPDMGHGYSLCMVLMEYLEGGLYNVDVVIFDGEMLAAFVTDSGPMLPGFFSSEVSICIPSTLPEEMKDQLITAAYRCCIGIGLRNGVYNVEFKLAKNGPKLVEINGRIGSYRRTTALKKIEGVDLLGIAVTIACNIKPYLQENTPNCFGVGACIFQKYHQKQLMDHSFYKTLRSMSDQGTILYIERTRDVDDQEDEFPKCSALIVAIDKEERKLARRKLVQLFNVLNLTSTAYDIENLTEMFA